MTAKIVTESINSRNIFTKPLKTKKIFLRHSTRDYFCIITYRVALLVHVVNVIAQVFEKNKFSSLHIKFEIQTAIEHNILFLIAPKEQYL